MSRIVVLIASHINDNSRIKLLKRAINSVNNNKRKPDAIYLSISSDVGDVSDFNNVTIIHHNKRKLQFEHLKFLTKYVKDDDIVCFLDDDDYYDRKKLDIVHKHMLGKDKDFILCHKYRAVNNGKYDENISEFWRLNMFGYLFKDWFYNTSKYCDLSFDHIIREYRGLTDLIFSVSLFDKCDFIDDVLIYHDVTVRLRSYHM